MKANRKFVEGDGGVSAVIGVILMVAITVAIAATVYVYVSGMIGGTTERTPTIIFNKDESANTLTVTSTDARISWTDVNMTAFDSNATANYWYAHGKTGNIAAGDVIDFDSHGLYNTVTINFRYNPTNALVGTYTLTSLTG